MYAIKTFFVKQCVASASGSSDLRHFFLGLPCTIFKWQSYILQFAAVEWENLVKGGTNLEE
jgi:hypothetical protein